MTGSRTSTAHNFFAGTGLVPAGNGRGASLNLMAEGTFSIRAVSAMIGVPAATLRTWEERYGLVVPERTPGGHRLYSRTQIEQLRDVADMVRSGISPGDAHRDLAQRLSSGEFRPVKAGAGGRSLLLVYSEHDPVGAEFAGFFLGTEGFETTVVGSAAEGEAQFRAGRPALVIIDLLVSSGGGLALCRTLCKERATPILAVSTLDDRDRALAAGASAFLTKPLDPLDFVATVKDLLGESARLGRQA
jgi:CheY-like chemotaxis protein